MDEFKAAGHAVMWALEIEGSIFACIFPGSDPTDADVRTKLEEECENYSLSVEEAEYVGSCPVKNKKHAVAVFLGIIGAKSNDSSRSRFRPIPC